MGIFQKLNSIICCKNNNDKKEKRRRDSLGNLVHLWGPKYGKFPRSCVIGPSWPIGLILFIFMCVCSVLHFKSVATQVPFPWFIILDLIIFGSMFYNYLDVACSDPGIVRRLSDVDEKIEDGIELIEKQQEEGTSTKVTRSTNENMYSAHLPETSECNICNVKGIRRSHCYECDVCFEENDHHCPWMTKCIAKNTVYSFYRFLCLFFFSIFYFTFTLIIQAMHLNKVNGGGPKYQYPQQPGIMFTGGASFG